MSTSNAPESNSQILKGLTDIEFRTFATPKLIRIVYVISVVLLTIGALFTIGGALMDDAAFGVLALLLGPVIWLFAVIYIRVVLETIMVLFRIAENTAPRAGGPIGPATPGPGPAGPGPAGPGPAGPGPAGPTGGSWGPPTGPPQG